MDSKLDQPPTLRWVGPFDGHLQLLDQTKLPNQVVEIECRTVQDVWEAIRALRVRGAPAIGIAAAYGVCLSLRTARDSEWDLLQCCHLATEACRHLATSRPTAVNLFWALERMQKVLANAQSEACAKDGTSLDLARQLLTEAQTIHEEDRQQCDAIGQHGARLLAILPEGAGILTHCNAGALATGGCGTALAVLFAMGQQGRRPHVFADETRPLLQGARLTMWELEQAKLDATLICDNMAAKIMQEGRIHAVLTGADRIAACGDTANKIGTYGLAVLARAHDLPFYIAAPTSTFDRSLATGAQIPIEERPASEITHCFGHAITPQKSKVYNPAFDVTPAKLITAIITQKGTIQPVNQARVEQHLDLHASTT